ncbi:hypothetical protein H8B02_02530 [Bradyrhizobium sp. Pear77]|uniref:hypothetical protein n=1 Tax=Bradyrhizobium altum TaxID=1571202 RepID=UPI001E5CE169|nr:hypothetical protein [Bradyrhizobium altum]MCC8952373.1 hypothetical protein [Bradyrhizobium altum]
MSNDCVRKPKVSPKHGPARPPITAAGIETYAGVLAAMGLHEILVTGNLPRGQTTQNVTYFIVDRNTKAIVSQLTLPDASNQFNGVEIRLKVARLSSAYDIGIFQSNGEFKPAEFLTVRSDLDTPPSSGASGRAA